MKKILLIATLIIIAMSGCSQNRTQPEVECAETTETAVAEEVAEESADAGNVVYPEVIPESSEEKVILEDILRTTYDVWLPGELPQTRWKRSRLVESEMILSERTAIVDGNCILSFGQPDEKCTVYLLANLASVNAVREVCAASELSGANRVIVCDISTYSTWFRNFVERRIAG